jgi:hypothetical protein
MQIYLRNLAKVKWKIETYIRIFQTQKKTTKMINVQSKVDCIKDGTSNVPSPNYSKKSYHYGFFSSRGVEN